MTLTVGMMPKSTGNPYFESCRRGAEEAATELGFALRWEGPSASDAQRQSAILAAWVAEGLPVVAVSVESRQSLSGALREARARGLKVITWDSDADQDARDFTVAQATAEGIAHALAFEVGRLLGGQGEFAVITSFLDAGNQSRWIAQLKERVARDYPGLQLLEVRPCEEAESRAVEEATGLLARHPRLGVLVGLCAPAVPGAGEAVKRSGRRNVRVTGLSVPSACRSYVQDGWVESLVTWNTRDLGYLAAHSAHGLVSGTLRPGVSSFRAGRLGTVLVHQDEVRLGRPHIVSKGNIDRFEA